VVRPFYQAPMTHLRAQTSVLATPGYALAARFRLQQQRKCGREADLELLVGQPRGKHLQLLPRQAGALRWLAPDRYVLCAIAGHGFLMLHPQSRSLRLLLPHGLPGD